jgi:hypothetical protein
MLRLTTGEQNGARTWDFTDSHPCILGIFKLKKLKRAYRVESWVGHPPLEPASDGEGPEKTPPRTEC